MRFLTKMGMNFLGGKLRLILLTGFVIGLCICSSLIYSDSLTVLRQLHLSIYGVTTRGIIHEKVKASNGKYYVTCSFLIHKADGSIESLYKKAEASDWALESVKQGDEIEIVYSSRLPATVWMLKKDADGLLGIGLFACFGLVFLISGGGGLMLMREK